MERRCRKNEEKDERMKRKTPKEFNLIAASTTKVKTYYKDHSYSFTEQCQAKNNNYSYWHCTRKKGHKGMHESISNITNYVFVGTTEPTMPKFANARWLKEIVTKKDITNYIKKKGWMTHDEARILNKKRVYA